MASAADHSDTGPNLSPPFALVVEDDPLGRRLLTAIVGRWTGMTVIPVATLAAALAVAADPEIIITDMSLTDGDNGENTVPALRRRWPEAGIVAVSGWFDERDARRSAIQGGADALLAKPYTADRLGLELERVLALPRVRPADLDLGLCQLPGEAPAQAAPAQTLDAWAARCVRAVEEAQAAYHAERKRGQPDGERG